MRWYTLDEIEQLPEFNQEERYDCQDCYDIAHDEMDNRETCDLHGEGQ